MELKDFIRDTLLQIVEGVSEAQANIAGTNAEIAPRIFGSLQHPDAMLVKGEGDGRFTAISAVKFDVALTESAGTGTKAGIGVAFGMLNLGSGGSSDSNKSSQTRIQFSVPLRLPGDRSAARREKS